MTGRTLFQKIWDDHCVVKGEGGKPDLLYIDLQLMHEVTSPIAFESLEKANRKPRRPELAIITEDHNTPTKDIDKPIQDKISELQLKTVRENAAKFGIRIHSLGDISNGVVHAFAPNLGLIHPGMTVVCGDSHTATHGAFGAIAFGIGTSEVEHVLATQTIWQNPLKNMRVEFKGKLPEGVSSKDMVLALIEKIGTGGGQGYAIEYCGEAIEELSQEARMTISNMTIEAGARVGIMRPDQKTFDYIKVRDHSPSNASSAERASGVSDWDAALEYWKTLYSDPDAKFDREIVIDVSALEPYVTWGTNPSQGTSIRGKVPTREEVVTQAEKDNLNEEVQLQAWERALNYQALEPGTKMKSIDIDTVFLGSCTNGRIEDLRAAASIIKQANELGLKMKVKRMLVVPGDGKIRALAEAEGLDKVFLEFGAEWRQAGCSMCLGMNDDRLSPGERSASTSNRNFESRQGKDGRTHLVSPLIAAATAVAGHLAEPADIFANTNTKEGSN